MSYSMSKFPERVSKLFNPRPPLQYKKPVDYPPEKRRTHFIAPLSSLVFSDTLVRYMQEHPQGSENRHLDKYEEVRSLTARNERLLEAEQAKWVPEEDSNINDTDPFRTIFVGRLPYEVDELELQKQFIKFGDIERVRIVRDKLTNEPKGYAFVLFKDTEGSRKAYREIGVHRGLLIKGRPVIVDIERGRTVKFFKPRRLGGGLGGRGYMKRERLSQLSVLGADHQATKHSVDIDRRSRFGTSSSGGRPQAHAGNYRGMGYKYGSTPQYANGPRFLREGSSYIPPTRPPATNAPVATAANPAQSKPTQTFYRSRRDRNINSDTTKSPSSMDY
ncbi:U1 snRNP complex subunit SNP1 Ecym_4324 [Eremothecium cymbalariae DBVPG|uniref:RRM domain-containing protein n=1 Tax=Eremothecium cymbalariae (strain CBS 270.75 / DBVPG 7215 / KCTC 17166 / NRRL Y-17582) TaxID=931890 RepID=G8JTN4_ERECY|nr:hypothetical protein Ecym_4324 [Eremothecium cymbalariae DBVPG\